MASKILSLLSVLNKADEKLDNDTSSSSSFDRPLSMSGYMPQRKYVATIQGYLVSYKDDETFNKDKDFESLLTDADKIFVTDEDVGDIITTLTEHNFNNYWSVVQKLKSYLSSIENEEGNMNVVDFSLTISANDKEACLKHLRTIENLISKQQIDDRKKAIIVKKLNSLREEIILDSTTLQRIAKAFVDFTWQIREGAENIEAIITIADKIYKKFLPSSMKLIEQEKPNLIEQEKPTSILPPAEKTDTASKNNTDRDDDIPF